MRQKIELDYKPYFPESINHAFLVMTNQGFINSNKLEEKTFNKAKQERVVIEKDLLNKMSDDAVDIIRIMLIAPKEFLSILSQITSVNKKGYFNKVKTSTAHTIKFRFRIWLMRFLKEKYSCSYLDADIRAGKIIREIKALVC
uniref:Uncharacterized protein n=1 Tax=viral metagenome TaxID=1070528 RepID=A0A6M3JMB6_9ZZZZ